VCESPTAPAVIPIKLRCCFDTEKHAKEFSDLVGACVREMSRRIDLSTLDGITIAGDYNQALLDLDRGYETKHKLTPSEEVAFGVAMTPAVLRDGKLKSHMLFRAEALLPLEDVNHSGFQTALHLLAHECAHVEVTHFFDAAFPNVLLRSSVTSLHAQARFDTTKACWDEFMVCAIAAPYGADPTTGYEETFIAALEEARPKANRLIRAFRIHQNVEQIMREVYGVYGDLMKFACYHLGNMAGRGLTVDDLPSTKSALGNHWFKPHFERLDAACKGIAEEYGRWPDRSRFEVIGDIVDDVVRERGLIASEFYVEVPFTPETS
jgi:hypothetical protein